MKRFKFLTFVAALVAVFSFPVLAADITAKNPNYNYVAQNRSPWLWEQINNDDTTKEQGIGPGLYEFFIDGTPANVDLKLQHGKTSGALKDINTSDFDDGGVNFSSASSAEHVNVCLSGGFVDISFTSAGTSAQDIDIWMSYLGEC